MNAFDQRYEEAQRRAATLFSTLDLLGRRGRPVGAEEIHAEDVRGAALGPLSDVAVAAVRNLTAQTLRNVDAIAAILAGLCPEDMAAFLADVPGWWVAAAVVNQRPAPRPRARARRRSPEPTPDMSPGSNEVLALEPPAAPVESPRSAHGAPLEDAP